MKKCFAIYQPGNRSIEAFFDPASTQTFYRVIVDGNETVTDNKSHVPALFKSAA